MEWNFWFTWWFLFHCRHPRLIWIDHQKRRNFNWKSTTSNLCEKKSIIVFKSKTSYKLELLTPETIKLLESIKKEVYKAKDGENVPKVESVEESVDTHQTFSLLLLQIKNSDS